MYSVNKQKKWWNENGGIEKNVSNMYIRITCQNQIVENKINIKI